MAQKVIKVRELIDRLIRANPDAYLCNAGSEWGEEVLDDVEEKIADASHPTLPEGSAYLLLSFDANVKKAVPKLYRCPHCFTERLILPAYSKSCRVCSWSPMMEEVNAPSCNETKAGSGEAYDPDQAVS